MSDSTDGDRVDRAEGDERGEGDEREEGNEGGGGEGLGRGHAGTAGGGDDTARQSVALLLAAARDDRHALAVLSQALDAAQAREVAVFCAYIAAQQFASDETRWSWPGLYENVLKEIALRLASGRPTDPTG